MADFETQSQESNSRTSSNSFQSDLDEDFNCEDSIFNNKLTRLMDWFTQKGIESGDPLSIQENYLKTGKNKIAQLLKEQGRGARTGQLLKKPLRKKLSVQTKFA